MSTERGFKTDTGPFGMSLEVFLARSEAPVPCFDLRQVVCFAYQCAFQTVHALEKKVDGVLPKGEKHTPFSSVLIPRPD